MKASRDSVRGEVYEEVEFLADGNRFPWTLRDFEMKVAWEEWREGDRATITFTEVAGKGRDGKDVTYRNFTGIEEAEDAAPSSKASQKGSPTPTPASKSDAPEPPPHAERREDPTRASIEAQVAAYIASDIMQNLLTTEDSPLEAKLALVMKHLPEITRMAFAAIQEAKGD
mgnify:FL=1